jgi:3-oxoacyl-[acyl-carrier protein] reductase
VDLGIRDTVFLVTGGTSGLGLAAARTLVDEGAKVVVSSRRHAAVDKAVLELGGVDGAHGIAEDNADPDAAERLLQMALSASCSPCRSSRPGPT